MLFHDANNLKNQSFGKPNAFLSILIASLLISTSAAKSQEKPPEIEILEERLNTYKKTLIDCVTQYQLQGADISMCANVFSSACLNDKNPEKLPSLLCTSFEGISWIELGNSTSPDKIGVRDGKTIIPPDMYLIESNLRSRETAELCGSIGIDQIEEANRCYLNRSIDRVKWHFQLYREGR